MTCDCLPFLPGCTDCGIADTFSRSTTSPSLGTADCGLTYSGTLVGAATIHANNVSGVITLAQTGIGLASFASATATLTPIPTLWDITARHTFQFYLDQIGDASIPAAEKIEVRFALTNQTLRVVILPSNSSLWTQDAGATPLASAYSQITWGSDLISGTQIPITFWVAGTVYTVGIYTSGSTRVGFITDGTSTYATSLGSVPTVINQVTFFARRDIAAPISSAVIQSVFIDNLIVPEVTKCSQYVFDDFHRTVANDWGGPWALSSGTPAHLSVNSTYGQMVIPTFDSDSVYAATGGWQTASGFTFFGIFLVDSVPGAGERVILFDMLDDDAFIEAFAAVSSDAGQGQVAIFSGGSSSVVKTDWVAFTQYAVRIEYVPGVLARMKLWTWGTVPEPSTWLVSTTGSSALTTNWYVNQYNQSSINPVTFRTFVIDFDYEGKPCYAGGPADNTNEPTANQPIQDELVGYWDGSTTVYTTDWPYNPQSLEIEADGEGTEVSTTDYLTGTFTLMDTASMTLGDEIRATYLRAQFI